MDKVTIRLAALDVDGTLLDSQRRLHEQTVSAVGQVKRQGVQVTLATGRTWGSTAPIARRLGVDLPVITYNGALIVCGKTGQTIEKTPMPLPAAQEMLEQLEQLGCYIKLYIDDHLFVQETTSETTDFSLKFGVPYTAVGRSNLSKIADEPLKITIIEQSGKIKEIWRLLERWQQLFTINRDGEYGIEIVNRSVNKGIALTKICRWLDIPLGQVMAVGNEGNDLQMLRMAGFGVAMGNADDDLKKHAKIMTATNDELGVAHVLQKYIIDGGTSVPVRE